MSNVLKVRGENGEFINIPYAKGEDGRTPYIGENGNWWIGSEDTGVKASGGTQIKKISELENDSGFITTSVNNLENYFTKQETSSEINKAIIGALGGAY